MQADVILKEPPPWMPPLSLSGGARVEGGAATLLVRPWASLKHLHITSEIKTSIV